jgi:hypothetical protein
MQYRRLCTDVNANVPEIVLDEDGHQIPCEYSTLQNLIMTADGIAEIRAARLGGKLSASMKKVVDCLCAIASKHHVIEGGELPFPHACYATSQFYNEVVASSRAHVLAGLSPDASTLFVVFAPLSDYACIVRAKVDDHSS